MKKVKLLRVLAGVIVGVAVLVGGTWLLSQIAGNDRPILVHGKSLEYWAAQVDASDTTASNQANAILNEEIIPMLTDQMFHDTNDSKIRLAVVRGLNNMAWIKYVTYFQAPGRRNIAAGDLGAFGPAAKAAVPALIQALQSGETDVHEAAIKSLGSIHCQPDVVIPLLTKYLDDDNLNDEAATALGEYGSLARPAVPKIIPLLHAPDDDAQAAAESALKKIDPAALTNAVSVTTTNK